MRKAIVSQLPDEMMDSLLKTPKIKVDPWARNGASNYKCEVRMKDDESNTIFKHARLQTLAA